VIRKATVPAVPYVIAFAQLVAAVIWHSRLLLAPRSASSFLKSRQGPP
jgi:hypothetical protein